MSVTICIHCGADITGFPRHQEVCSINRHFKNYPILGPKEVADYNGKLLCLACLNKASDGPHRDCPPLKRIKDVALHAWLKHQHIGVYLIETSESKDQYLSSGLSEDYYEQLLRVTPSDASTNKYPTDYNEYKMSLTNLIAEINQDLLTLHSKQQLLKQQLDEFEILVIPRGYTRRLLWFLTQGRVFTLIKDHIRFRIRSIFKA